MEYIVKNKKELETLEKILNEFLEKESLNTDCFKLCKIDEDKLYITTLENISWVISKNIKSISLFRDCLLFFYDDVIVETSVNFNYCTNIDINFKE